MNVGDRTPNWSAGEKCMAIGLINDHYEALFAKFKGATTGGINRKDNWQSIADQLNSSGTTQCTRTVEQIRRMYSNVKQRAKEKDGDKKKTGGGGANLKLTQCEDMVLEGIKDKPQLRGIVGGLDTSSTESSKANSAGSTVTTQYLTESSKANSASSTVTTQYLTNF